MKKLILIALLVFPLLTGCVSETEYGPCIGAGDDKDPNLIYHVEGLNIALGIIFAELIVPPVVVIANELQCPVGVRK